VILRIFPLLAGIRAEVEVSATWEARLVSSRKLHAGTRRGEDGKAKETRLCFAGVDVEAGKGAVNEKVGVDGGLKGESRDLFIADYRRQ
jgi:hypothetical protein